MLLRPYLNDASSCASYLFGCGANAKLAVVDPHTGPSTTRSVQDPTTLREEL